MIMIVALVLGVAACKKDTNAITGKWQAAKMRVYNLDINTGAISGDTTYQANTFGRFDYVQFDSRGNCVLSATEQVTNAQYIQEYIYTKSGSEFSLKPAHTDPYIISGISTSRTALVVSSGTLIIHAITGYLNPSVPYKTISDSYYTK